MKKRKQRTFQRGQLWTAVEALKRKLALEALNRHKTLEGAAKALGITPKGVATILRRHGCRFRVKIVRTLELLPPQK